MKVLWTTNEPPMEHASLIFISSLQRKLVDFGIEVELIRLGNLRSPWAIRRASRIVNDCARFFDVIHAQNGSACALASSRCTGRPFIVTLRGSDWNVHPDRLHWLFYHTHLAKWFSECAIKRADTVICVSHRLRQEVLRQFKTMRVEYMPTPIDMSQFRPFVGNIIDAKQVLRDGRDITRPWVLFNSLNITSPIKRFTLAKAAVVEAERLLSDRVELIIAHSMSHNRIPALTRACDLILSTSTKEGWPNCVKEALASNVPFVATDTSDLSEIAAIETSCRVTDATPTALGAAIAEVIKFDRSNPPINLRRHIEHMELEASAQRLIECYRTTIRGNKPISDIDSIANG